MSETIRELIAELSAIENQDQPIISKYFLAENFEYADGTPTPSPKKFEDFIVMELTSYDDIWESSYDLLNNLIYEFMRQFVCNECDEPISDLERAGNDGVCDSCQQLEESE
jgi:hypothetical protein